MSIFNLFKQNKKPSFKFSTEVVDHVADKSVFYDDSHIRDAQRSLMACNKSLNGLLPHEILMLAYATGYKKHGNSFQQFWYYKYGVEDPQAILDKLEKNGLIALGDAGIAIRSLKVSDLKTLTSKHNLSSSGKKNDLIQRLLSSVPISELAPDLPEPTYVLTSKGEYELKCNEYVLYIHKHPIYEVQLWQMNKWVHSDPNRPYRDFIWAEFNRRTTEYMQKRNCGYYRNNRLHMMYFLLEEDRLLSAFDMLCEVLFLDTAVFEVNRYLYSDSGAKLSDYCKLPYGIVKQLEKISFQLKLNYNELFPKLCEQFSNMSLFISLWVVSKKSFSVEDTAGLIIAQLNNDYLIFDAVCAEYEKQFQKYKRRP